MKNKNRFPDFFILEISISNKLNNLLIDYESNVSELLRIGLVVQLIYSYELDNKLDDFH